MIDPILSLSFSLHSNKGVYALLLGSGISRPAGLPTGWEVTLDLIRKLAHVTGENCEPDPAKWYEEKFSEEADYSKLLNSLAKTPSERSNLLKSYFEPSEEEREQKLKTSTSAHKAIANLIAQGYVKVVITTNFDRLLEKALEEAGVTPIVISTTDAIHGAPPIVHTPCTLIKVHGDYLDTRIKNTPEELAVYDVHLNALLDRVFDEFGLIICGWSGDWDTALRDSIVRSKSRRFTTYWTAKDPLSEKAKEIADFRKAEILPIQTADFFFTELSEKITAIKEFERPHPLSAQVAVATFKRYLPDDKYRIQLHDLVMQETDRLFENISPVFYPTQKPEPDKDTLLQRIKQYETKSEILQAMMIAGGYWGNQTTSDLFVKCLERLIGHYKEQNGYKAWINLQLYPALLLLFSEGLAALASDNYQVLATLLLKPRNNYAYPEKELLIFSLLPAVVMEQNVGRLLPNMERRHTPASDWLVETLYQSLREYIPEKNDFEDKFDRLEYLISLTICDHLLQTSKYHWIPIGRFGWRNRDYGNRHISSLMQNEIESEKENWKPLKAGFFGGSFDRANAALARVTEQLSKIHMW